MEQSSESDYFFKTVIIGDANVGKSSILLRHTDDTFSDIYTQSMSAYRTKVIDRFKQHITFQMWDVSSNKKYNKLNSICRKGAHGVIIVYDLTNRKSFESVKDYYQETLQATEKVKPECPTFESKILLVANKSDLQNNRAVTFEEGYNLASIWGITFLETSAKTQQNVHRVFETLQSAIMVHNGVQKAKKKSFLAENFPFLFSSS